MEEKDERREPISSSWPCSWHPYAQGCRDCTLQKCKPRVTISPKWFPFCISSLRMPKWPSGKPHPGAKLSPCVDSERPRSVIPASQTALETWLHPHWPSVPELLLKASLAWAALGHQNYSFLTARQVISPERSSVSVRWPLLPAKIHKQDSTLL